MHDLRQSKKDSSLGLIPKAALLLAALFSSLGLAAAGMQDERGARASLTPTEFERLLEAASVRAGEYTSSFRDLTAEERQSVELYNHVGVLIRRREILSDFIIYQSRFDKGVAAEYRNVREVDGAPVEGRDERVVRFFKKLASSSSLNQELQLISAETSRYDLNYSIQGYTVKQGLPLQRELRGLFAFELAGTEQIDGRETIIVSYRQRAQSPLLRVDLKLPSLPKPSETFYRGRLWLDARTAQIRREEREVAFILPKVKEPLVLIRQEFYYTASQFEILVPQRITLTTLGSVQLKDDRVAASTVGGRLIFQYGPFSRFTVVIPGANVRDN